MAYRKQKQRILAGSLNFLPPGDLTPEPDSIRLENWRVDKAGALHSRKGVVAAATGLPGPVHSLFRIGDDRYGGAGEELRYGRDLSVQVQSGFDGQPLGFAAMSGMAWVMNRAKRGKVRGANWYEWVPAPPTEAPTVAAGAERTLTVAEFESPEWWDVFYRAAGSDVWQSSPIYVDVAADEGTVAVTNGSKQVVGTGTNWDATMVGKDIRIYTDDPDVVVVTVVESVQDATHLTLATAYDQATASGLSYQISETKYSNQTDGNDKISGSFSQILNAFWPGFWRLAPASDWAFGPKDLRFDGKANDDDVFRLWIKSDTPESIASVTVTFLSGSGATRQGVSATIPASKFTPATGEWMRVEIRRRLDPYSLVNANQEYQDLLRRMQAAQERGNQVEYDTLNQQRYELFQQIVREAPYFSNVSGETGAVRFDWSDVTEMRIDIETTKSCVVHVDLAEWVAKVDGALEGEYRFYVTYEDIHGHESNPSPASEPVTL
ncbi:MAG TPA: hypothetical protein ENK13_01105, partial [Thermopetrobacter sp.]|nr:hypothetical protein [Thermopetrobacter sp.]